jgi:hypothetical protein
MMKRHIFLKELNFSIMAPLCQAYGDGNGTRGGFFGRSKYVDVCNLRFFDLSLALGRPLSSVTQSSVFISTDG